MTANVTVAVDAEAPAAVFAPVLERLRADGARYFGLADPEIEIVRYMSRAYSQLAQVKISKGPTSVRAFVKVARLQQDSAEERVKAAAQISWAFETMSRLHQQMRGLDGLSVVRPIACFPEELAIVTEEASGSTLLDLLEGKGGWWPSAPSVRALETAIRRVGEWMRSYQRVCPPLGDRMTPAEIREYVDVRLRILAARDRGGFSEAKRQRVLRAFDARVANIAPERLMAVHVHADFALGNVLVSGRDIVVLDFAAPARGLAPHDVTHLHMQLGLLAAKPKFRPATVRALQRSLLQGYGDGLNPSDPLFELLTLQHVVCHFTGLLKGGGRPVERAYNWYLQRRHRSWLDAFASRP